MSNRRTILDYPRNEAGLVDEFIGTAYDAMYAIYQNLDALLNVNINVEGALNAAEAAKLSAIEAAKQADRAQKIVDDFEAHGGRADFTQIGIYMAQAYGLVGGEGVEESLSINKAIDACGKAGGGVVIVRAKKDGDPVYINKPVQIEMDNVTLQYESEILYGPKGTMRVSGNYKEIRRTELGQKDLIALAANSSVDAVGEMQFIVRPGEGKYLRIGDRVTLRGENDAVGNALEKQTVTIKGIDGDTISCFDVPELTFKAVYPNSEWEPDHTTGTTVSIVNYSAFTADATGPNVLDVEVEDGSKFSVGELVYVSDARKERDLMNERDLVSSAIMEHAIIAKIVGNTVTFDKPLARQYLRGFKGGISSLKAIFNSHIRIKELSWAQPQPDRKNSAVGINFGWKSTVLVAKMDGRSGRVGTAVRVAYSYDCEVFDSEFIGGLRYASAECYGAVLYYSTHCRIRNSLGSGNRHNFLIQTCVACDILDNISTDDYISGIDLHGAGAINCRIMGNRVSRSKNYSPDASIGGGIRNGNTSHVIGDHGTLIYNNYIEGYNNRNETTGRYESAAIDVSPASQGVIVRDNHMVDCSIGFRHYRVSPTIQTQRVTKRIVLIGNTFERISEKLVQMSLGTATNTLVEELIMVDNKSIDNSKQFEIDDVPRVRLINNQIIAPRGAAGVFGFSVKKCPDLIAVGNFAAESNKGFRIEDCPNAKVFKNVLDLTREGVPFMAAGNNNAGYIERGNTLADSGGSGATIQIGTVTTGVPGSQAQVVNVGTEQDAVFNFVIPRGDPGKDGGGTGSDFVAQKPVLDLNELTLKVQNLLITNAQGNLDQIATGAEGRAVLALDTTVALKERLGVDQVDNTRDAEKPVSTAQRTAIDKKADTDGPTFTGRPFAPHPALPLNPAYATQIATAGWTMERIAEEIDKIPAPAGGKMKHSIALLGDSLSSNNSDRGGHFTRGFMTWAQFLTDHKLYHPSSLNFGDGGANSTGIAANAPNVVAARPDICLLEMGGNDIGNSGQTIEIMRDNLDRTLKLLLDANIYVILCTIYPVQNVSTQPQYTKLMQFNQYIRQKKFELDNVEIIDTFPIVMKKDGTDQLRVDYSYDGTHPGPVGSYWLGVELAKIYNQLAPAMKAPLMFNNKHDIFNITTNPLGNAVRNGLLTGSGGTVNGTGATGITPPDDWILDMSQAKGMTVVLGEVPATADEFRGITFTLGGQTPAANSGDQVQAAGHITLTQQVSGDGSSTGWKDTAEGKFWRDQLVEISAVVEYEDLVGVMGAGIECWVQESVTDKPGVGYMIAPKEQKAVTSMGQRGALNMPTGKFKGYLYSPCDDMGKPSKGFKIQFRITSNPGVPVSGKVTVRQINFKRCTMS